MNKVVVAILSFVFGSVATAVTCYWYLGWMIPTRAMDWDARWVHSIYMLRSTVENDSDIDYTSANDLLAEMMAVSINGISSAQRFDFSKAENGRLIGAIHSGKSYLIKYPHSACVGVSDDKNLECHTGIVSKELDQLLEALKKNNAK